MAIRATLYDGRTIASVKTTILAPAAGNYTFTVTVPQLRLVETILEYRINTTPVTDPGSPTNESISGNVVTVAIIGVGAGTTLSIEVTALGV